MVEPDLAPSAAASDSASQWAWVAHHVTLAAALTALVVGLVHFVNLTFDDAFIPFRYAENLARGHGLVFNPGERVEGYSNFLWTVLLVIPVWLGADRSPLGMLVVAKLLGALLSVGTLVLLWRTAGGGRPKQQRRSAPVAPLYVALLAPFLVWGVGGLETPLVTLLLVATVHLYLRETSSPTASTAPLPWSAVTLALAALTRPEPIILLVPLVALRIWRRLRAHELRRCWRQEATYPLVFALPYGLFLWWRWAYYGQLLPNTYYAKLHADRLAWQRGREYLTSASVDLNWGAVVLASLVLVLLARRWSHRATLFTLLLLTHAAGVAYEGGDWMPAFRLLVPVVPVVGLLVHEAWVAAGYLQLSQLGPPNLPLRPGWLRPWRDAVTAWARASWAGKLNGAMRMAARATLVLTVLLGALGSFRAVRVRGLESGLLGVKMDCFDHYRIARWMKQNIDDAGLLATGEVGIVPYYTRLPVLDTYGLTDPYIARLRGVRHRKFDADYVLSRRPKYVLLLVYRSAEGKLTSVHAYARVLLQRPDFARQYAVRHDFGTALLYERVPHP